MAKSKLAEIKTKPTSASVEEFINTIKDEQKRKDSFAVLEEIDLKVLKGIIDASAKRK